MGKQDEELETEDFDQDDGGLDEQPTPDEGKHQDKDD